MHSSLLYDLNHARVWQQSIRVWDHELKAGSFDRLLYLSLHRVGWMGEHEARLLRALITPGMQVVDIGANIGLYSLLCAELTGSTGRVFAFEPDPKLFAVLVENCAVNHAANVELFECAAGATAGSAAFQRSAFNSGDNSLDLRGVGSVQVRVARVDDSLPVLAVDFIKIDVQGHELTALSGMERLLAASSGVRVLFELSPAELRAANTEPEALLDFFRDRGFKIYATDEWPFREVTEPAGLIRKLLGRRYTNLLASRTPVVSS